MIETESGVIDGGLKVELRALERGIREGVAAVLRSHDLADASRRTKLEAIERSVRETLAALAVPTQPALSKVSRLIQRPVEREVT